MIKYKFKWWMYPLAPLGLLACILYLIILFPIVRPAAWCVALFCALYDVKEPDWVWNATR